MSARVAQPATTGRRRRATAGQAMVEFALVAPIFFLILFGIVEAGRFMLYYQALNNATREGARYAIVNGANTLGCPSGPNLTHPEAECDREGALVIARVRAAAFGVLGGPTLAVAPDWDPDNSRGSTVTVEASYTYSPLIPIPFPPITVTARSSLVVNN
jgi:hypothetical protein